MKRLNKQQTITIKRSKRFLLFLAFWVLVLAPLKVFSDECKVGSLKITLNANSKYQLTESNGTHISSSFHRNAEGHVMFYIDKKGRLNIISKSINGELSGESYTDTGCAHHESHSTGTLTEGRVNSKGGIYAAYWKIHQEFNSNYKNTRGCMKQSPVSGSNDVEEVEPLFEGIVHPVSKIESLCNSVARNPKLGYCKQTSNGYYGTMMEKSSLSKEGGPQVQASIVYEWSLEKVPCECEAQITDYRGDVKINGHHITGKTRINLRGTTIETGHMSGVKLTFNNGSITIASNSTVDLSETCQEKSEPSVLNLIKGAIFYVVNTGGLHQPRIVLSPNAHAGVRGTKFILIAEDDKTVVMVLEGEVSFWDINKRKTVIVKKNQKSICEKGGTPTDPVFLKPQEIPVWIK